MFAKYIGSNGAVLLTICPCFPNNFPLFLTIECENLICEWFVMFEVAFLRDAIFIVCYDAVLWTICPCFPNHFRLFLTIECDNLICEWFFMFAFALLRDAIFIVCWAVLWTICPCFPNNFPLFLTIECENLICEWFVVFEFALPRDAKYIVCYGAVLWTISLVFSIISHFFSFPYHRMWESDLWMIFHVCFCPPKRCDIHCLLWRCFMDNLPLFPQ